MTLLLVAVLLDLLVGEPPGRWHPVAWIGSLIAAGRRLSARRSPRGLLISGALLIATASAATWIAALLVEEALAVLPDPLGFLLEAWLLKCAFSLRGLFQAVELVRGHLVAGDIEGARREVGLHLVSRPTGDLDAGAVSSAAVESLAENLTDSWVAPICFFLVGGLAAAWAYRAVNTADAMVGYRQGELEYLGRAAARLDDALSFIPARLVALALVLASPLAGASAAGAWRAVRRDGSLTASPNAGPSMAAMAGALGVTLEKRGHYRLGTGPLPDLRGIDRAMRLARWAAALPLGMVLLGLGATRCARR